MHYKMKRFGANLCSLIVFIACHAVECRKSMWVVTIDQNSRHDFTIFPNTMFKGSYVSVNMVCSSREAQAEVNVYWILEELECMEEMYQTAQTQMLKDQILTSVTYDMLKTSDHLSTAPDRIVRDNLDTDSNYGNESVAVREMKPGPGVQVIKFMLSEPHRYNCGKQNIISLMDETASPYYTGYYRESLPKGDPDRFMWKAVVSDWKTIEQSQSNEVAKAWSSGVYHFILKVEPADREFEFNATAIIKMKSDHGYLPAIEWPLLLVRGVLSLLYLSIGTGWIILWARSHQHTLKMHIIIGAISVAGALANTMDFVELSNQNATGNGVQGVKWLGMFLTVLQNGLMQILVMIVSTGYGITRPNLHKNLLGGAVSLATVSSLVQFMSVIVLDEEIRIKYSHPTFALIISILYYVFTIIVAGWIMIFSIMTFVHLCQRNHSSKKVMSFTLFTATCVFTFIVSLVLGLVSLGITKTCSKDWHLEWLLKSYGSMSALVLLVVLMWLWRPVDEAQTYAFAPVNTEELSHDPGDYEGDEDDDTLYEKITLEPL